MSSAPDHKRSRQRQPAPEQRGNLTIYGRNPVAEALREGTVEVLRVHLSRSNRASEALTEIEQLARQADIPIVRHSKLELSRISRNSRQDQGVAADLRCTNLYPADILTREKCRQRLIALDRINNPQNLGMAIRSIAAGHIDGLLLGRDKGTTQLSPLVIKASVGTFFRTPIYQCGQLADSLEQLKSAGHQVITLAADAPQSLFELPIPDRCIFVLGNESEGVSSSIQALSDCQVGIPLGAGVESLNVAVTAALVSFLEPLRSSSAPQ